MIIWEFLGFGVNHQKIVKYEQKAIEQQKTRIEILLNYINYHVISKLLQLKRYYIKVVLKYFDETLIKNTYWEKNWTEIKQWLYQQEHSKFPQSMFVQKELKKSNQKIQKLEEKDAEFEENK